MEFGEIEKIVPQDIGLAVYISLGQASMCWEEVPEEGFDYVKINEIAINLCSYIASRMKEKGSK